MFNFAGLQTDLGWFSLTWNEVLFHCSRFLCIEKYEGALGLKAGQVKTALISLDCNNGVQLVY